MDALTLGPFIIDRDGVLQPRTPAPPPALRFAWRGRPCVAELGGPVLRLASRAARIPSTAEPGADRERAFAGLATLPHGLAPGWRLRLLPDHQLRIEAEAPLDSPPTATSLIAALVRFGLALDPCLDRLEEAGLR